MDKFLIFQNSFPTEFDTVVIDDKVMSYNQSEYQTEIGKIIIHTNKMFDYGKLIRKFLCNVTRFMHIYIRREQGVVVQSNFLDKDNKGRLITYTFFHSLSIIDKDNRMKNIANANYLKILLTDCDIIVSNFLEYCKIVAKTPSEYDLKAMKYALWIYAFQKIVMLVFITIIALTILLYVIF